MKYIEPVNDEYTEQILQAPHNAYDFQKIKKMMKYTPMKIQLQGVRNHKYTIEGDYTDSIIIFLI